MKAGSGFDLHGIVTPLVTPLLENNELDVAGLEKLLNHVLGGGVQGIFILGTTGEFSRLTTKVKEEMISATSRIVGGRVKVLVGITDTSMQESIKLADIARKESADAVVLAPPFYYSVDQNELLEYFKHIASIIELPLYLYNIPARTNIDIEIETVVAAAGIPGIVGIKDSSGDMFFFQKLMYALKDHPGFSVFIGPEEIMPQAVLFGASGGVNGGANMFPELFVKLYEAARNKDLETVYRLQDIVTSISSTLYRVGNQPPNYIKIVKSVLSQMNICSEHMTEPYIPFNRQEQQQISKYMENIENKLHQNVVSL